MELLIIVGAEGQEAAIMGPEFGWRDPPCHRAPDNLDLQPDPRNEIDDVEAGDDKLTLGAAGARGKGGSFRSGVARHPWATARSGGGFSPAVSPIT